MLLSVSQDTHLQLSLLMLLHGYTTDANIPGTEKLVVSALHPDVGMKASVQFWVSWAVSWLCLASSCSRRLHGEGMVSDHFSFHHFAGWIPETRVLEGRTGGTSGVILMAVIDDIRCTCIDGCLALFQFNIKLVRLFRRTSNSSAVASFQISIQWNDAYFLSRYVQCQVLRYTSRNDSVCVPGSGSDAGVSFTSEIVGMNRGS